MGKNKKLKNVIFAQEPNGQKKVKHSVSPSEEKQTKRENEPGNYDTLFASWAFSKIQRGGLWDITQKDWIIWNDRILSKLSSLESMTWAEIKVIPKDGRKGGNKHHNISVEDFSKKAKDELKRLNLHYDELFSLRLTNRERIFGFLERGTLYLIWYDAEHEICPSQK